MISFVIPVYNEEKILEANILKLLDFFKKNYPNEFQIIISDNASSDKTPEIAKNLAEKFPEIKYLRLEQKGKGLAIAEGWKKFPADIYLFSDADLSCDLNGIPKFIEAINPSYKIPLVPPLIKGEGEGDFDLACGSRHLKNSKDFRPLARKIISKIWNLAPKILLKTKLADTACGIKAINQRVVDEILPEIKNREWFFDTEMVLRAERAGLKIVEIPITWTELKSRQSKVNFLNVGAEYLKNLMRLKNEL